MRSDVIGRCEATLTEYQAGPLADYVPYTHHTRALFEKLGALKPERFAIMHGSSYEGDGVRALNDLADVFEKVLGPPSG
jgi:hypothetical protein